MKKTPCFGLIVAAGEGTRFGGRKQFARLASRPLLCYSLQAFEHCSVVKETVLVTNLDMIERLESWTKRWRLRKVKWIVAGGKSRQESVRQGLRVLPDKCLVAVHDGVRPCILPAQIALGFGICAKTGAAVPVLPVAETVKEIADGMVVKTIPHAGLALAQTPQFFEIALLRNAHRQAASEGFLGTDDAQLVEHYGGRVTAFLGWQENVKITTRDDLLRIRELVRL